MKEKTAFITGANKGIGFGIAKHLGLSGWRIIIGARNQGRAEKAIRELTDGVLRGDRAQVLLGVTGSGKTFTMANVIANCNKPTLILSHNKTLAAQLYEEFKEFFFSIISYFFKL